MRNNRTLYAIIIFALILRIITVFALGSNKTTFGDAQDYLNTAKHICEYHSYPEQGNMPFFRAPLLPAYISMVTLCCPENVSWIKLSFTFVDCLTIIAIFYLSLILFNNRIVSILSALLASIYPVFLFQLTDIRTEPLFMFFITAAMLFFFKSMNANKALLLLASGIFVSLAALTRPAALILIPFLFISFLFKPNMHLRRKVIMASFFLIGSTVILFPWVLRNYVKFNELILVNDAGGYNFWRGSSPEMYELTKIKDQELFMREAQKFETEYAAKYMQEINAKTATPMTKNRAWHDLGMQNIKENTAIYTKYTLYKALNYWRIWLNPQEHGKKKAMLSALIFTPVYFMGIIGIIHYRKRNKWQFNFILLYFLLIWGIHIPFQVVIRFRIPFTDPFLLIFTASIIVAFTHRERQSQISS